MAEERKRELPLPPGTYAYVLDSTKGVVKLYVGPTVINQTGQDRPVKYNPKSHKFDECGLEEALQQNMVVPEGFYAVLTNPAKDKSTGKIIYPSEGSTQATPDLAIGLKENIPGPVNFALFPGQTCEVRRGHQLRSNEYLRIKIYNEDKAKENWAKAVIKVATTTTGDDPVKVDPQAPKAPDEKKKDEMPSISAKAPADLAVGKQYNILGTEVAFYIPPTGVSVVPEGVDATNKEIFVRQAETLGLNEYSILVDENGNKDYPKGPSVVFPKPTQEFLVARRPDGSVIKDEEGMPSRKFKAIEMNALQGIQLKFAKSGELVYANGDKEPYSAGDEKFIRGDKMPIYYPEEGHTLVRYDGKSIHYAAAVTEGEAKYVLERETGNVKLVKGPTMLLPDPVKETIVWRPLSEREARTWFPGSDGRGSVDSVAWNQKLRQEAANSPTTRQGVVSEGQLRGGDSLENFGADKGGLESAAFMNYAVGVDRGVATKGIAPTRARSSSMAESRQGKDQQAVVGDVAERKSTYNEPRTLILGSQKRGVPTIKVQPGYVVNVIKSDGSRVTVKGPKTILMEFSDTLDILRLSTGKPKNTDTIFDTVYLNIHNNKITDVIDDIETSDHVVVSLKLSYNVNFEGDPSKWFSIENYVKHLCDHIRSVLKGGIRKLTIEEFYRNPADYIRNIILGVKPEKAPLAKDGDDTVVTKRPGMFFEENNMRVTDVDALKTEIKDSSISGLLLSSQQTVVRQNIQLGLKQKELDVTLKVQDIERQSLIAVYTTEARRLELEGNKVDSISTLNLAKVDAEKDLVESQSDLERFKQVLLDLAFDAELKRNIRGGEAMESLETLRRTGRMLEIDKQVEAIARQLAAIQPGLIEGLNSASAKETLVKIAGSMSFHQMFGAENGVEFLQKVFANTPLQGLIDGVVSKAGALAANGTVKNPNIPQSQA